MDQLIDQRGLSSDNSQLSLSGAGRDVDVHA